MTSKKESSRKGFRHLFTCDDCGHKMFVTAGQRWRAAKPRCTRCGCGRLTPSDAARDDLASLAQIGGKAKDSKAAQKPTGRE